MSTTHLPVGINEIYRAFEHPPGRLLIHFDYCFVVALLASLEGFAKTAIQLLIDAAGSSVSDRSGESEMCWMVGQSVGRAK